MTSNGKTEAQKNQNQNQNEKQKHDATHNNATAFFQTAMKLFALTLHLTLSVVSVFVGRHSAHQKLFLFFLSNNSNEEQHRNKIYVYVYIQNFNPI